MIPATSKVLVAVAAMTLTTIPSRGGGVVYASVADIFAGDIGRLSTVPTTRGIGKQLIFEK